MEIKSTSLLTINSAPDFGRQVENQILLVVRTLMHGPGRLDDIALAVLGDGDQRRQIRADLRFLPFEQLHEDPFDIAQTAVSGPFTLVTLDLGEAAIAEYVYVENLAGALLMDKVAEIDIHRLTFDALRADVLGPEKSITLIEKAAAELA